VVTIEEVSQIFVSGRSFDLGDLAADFLGIIAFGELARFIAGRKTDFRLRTGD
jgi:VanZ family protein